MRRLTQHDRNDHGVVTLFVVGIVAVLLVAAACAIDVGRYDVESWSAQNSADATVLAVATDCASGGSPVGGYSDYYKADDGQTINTPVCSSNETTVTVTKPVSGGLLLNRDARTVQRSATAKWGAIGSATTAPVVISQCTFDLATANGTTFPSAERIIPLGAGVDTCPGRPPGAFGWLDTGLDGPCSINTTLNSSGQLVVHGNTGNGNVNPWDCITQVGVNGTIMIPIYGASCNNASPCVQGQNDGNGNNNHYLILGYAEIQVTGWNLQHGDPKKAGTPVPNCPGSGSASCIRGRFVRFTTQLGSPGPGGEFGGKAIYLFS